MVRIRVKVSVRVRVDCRHSMQSNIHVLSVSDWYAARMLGSYGTKLHSGQPPKAWMHDA